MDENTLMDPNKKTLIVFSGDLDKALAAFILANGAAAMGNDVTMFFTFWGLNIIRKPEKVKVHRRPLQAAFGRMMPRGADRLGLSKMNFAGLGPVMMKKVMREANISTLNELIAIAQEQEITMVACTTSMEVLGLTKEELLDGVELAGVASYFEYADHANVNLLI
jgi:peroxiredoxin family protein